MSMEPRIHVITLAVADPERSMEFYRDGLGFRTEGIIGTEFKGNAAQPAGAAAMFELGGGLILSLYPRSELAKDANEKMLEPASTEFSLGHLVANRSEVDRLLGVAKAAGAVLTDAAHERPWGIYSGYFKDPDGHLWEVIYNPALPA